jgi:Ala-tRNA(Pro) deacylase
MTVLSPPAPVQRIERYLRDHDVPFELQHLPARFTARGVAATEHIPASQFAKVVVVAADARFYMLVLPASHRLPLEHLGPALGLGETVVQLATEQELARLFPDCTVGAMPPFGNLYGIDVYVDPALAANETITFSGGTHSTTMRMTYADFARLAHPKMIRPGPPDAK